MHAGRLTRIGITLTLVLAASGASAQRNAAQLAAWRTPSGGDPSGNYLSVQLAEREASLRGTRRVERIDAPSGYTTGTTATVVFEGREPEADRSLRVHLPYGASLDLAVGDVVDVEASSRLRGLGTMQEVVVKRGDDIVLLTTSRDRVAGIRVARGNEAPREGSRRRFGLRVTMAGREVSLAPNDLFELSPMLMQGTEIVYEGVRPPDAFDTRVLTIVRIRPAAR